jgi:nucleoid-associated protein YgaU
VCSLTAHLLETGDHGRLRFHPSCPVCRQERLYGNLSSEPVVSRRAQALLAGGVLALSASAPTVSLAQEPDRQFEGVAAPEEPGGPELDDPGFDPGGDTELSFDTAPAPAAPEDGDDSGDGAPLDVEPTVDVDARLAPLAETDASLEDEQSAVPPAEIPSPDGAVPPSEPAPGAVIPPAAPTQPAAPETPGEPVDPAQSDVSPAPHRTPAGGLVRGLGTHVPSRARYANSRVRSDAGAPASSQRVSDGAGASPVPHVPSVSSDPEAVAVTQVETPPVAEIDGAPRVTSDDPSLAPGPASYVVQPGDSLWSIARQLVGREASAGRIAREVNRLWSLNRSRIATGDPDLLMVGTRLELR